MAVQHGFTQQIHMEHPAFMKPWRQRPNVILVQLQVAGEHGCDKIPIPGIAVADDQITLLEGLSVLGVDPRWVVSVDGDRYAQRVRSEANRSSNTANRRNISE